MTTGRPIGQRLPAIEVAERALAENAALRGMIGELVVRLEALEAKVAGADGEDGPAPQPLGPNWRPIKAAAALVGYSESALRKASDGGRARWWQYRGGRIRIDTDRCPRRP